jgi:hypothetical protein
MRRTRHAFLVFSWLTLLIGCSPSGSITLQPGINSSDASSSSASGKGAVTLGPGELNEVYLAKKNLPPGGHIDVTATNGQLAFKPDNNPAHSATGHSIATKSVTGITEHTPAFVTPEAEEALKRRVPAS